MEEDLISVALCTYDGEKHLSEQLDSIIQQTYKNLEIIIVDDASTDSTFSIVSEYALRDERIKPYRNDANLGYNKNFEKALRLASGKYIAISDQDDIWLPDKLRELFNKINDSWLIFSNSSYMDGDKGGKLLKDLKVPHDYKGFLFRNYVTGHTVLINCEFLNFALPFPESGFYDWWMGFVAVYHHKLTFYDKVLTYYRVHDESVIQKRKYLRKSAALVEFETNLTMLNAFENYKNLGSSDSNFIRQLKEAYEKIGSGHRSIPLMKKVVKYYHDLFPNRKPWKSLIKPIFAFNFSKGIKNIYRD